MRSNKYQISRLIHEIEFGKEESTGKLNPNTGKPMKGFVAKTTAHYGTITTSVSQTISTAGSTLANTKVIAIRHNPLLYQYQEAMIDGSVYLVSSISKDEQLNAYDLYTLTAKTTHA